MGHKGRGRRRDTQGKVEDTGKKIVVLWMSLKPKWDMRRVGMGQGTARSTKGTMKGS